MQDKPLVTVICLCYNHEKYVVETLNSVINQDYPNIELIISDDCSSDNSVSVIENWLQNHQNIIFIKNNKNLGSNKTFNNAFELAKGEFIIDLAADDILLPHCISKQVTTFINSKYDNLGLVYANFNLVDENRKFKSIYFNSNEKPESGDVYKMVISRSVKLGSLCSLYKTSIFRNLGGYDETLAYEDLDIWVRITRNFKVEYIDDVLAEKRELENSLSAHFLKKNNAKTHFLHQSTLQIFKKILDLNQTRNENKVVLNRMKFEMHKFITAREWKLTFQLFKLMIKAYIKSIF
ncbi:MAG: glycosyltransferase [Flavobacterium sp.]|nr:glycosyltransferase [Flavobacterium sp.]